MKSVLYSGELHKKKYNSLHIMTCSLKDVRDVDDNDETN